jgi:hypothetical protein
MSQHQTGGTSSYDSDLRTNLSHHLLVLKIYANFSITSLGIGWLLALVGSPGDRTVHTRFLNPSTANFSPRNNFCSTEKLEVPHRTTLDSTITISPKLEGTKKRDLLDAQFERLNRPVGLILFRRVLF